MQGRHGAHALCSSVTCSSAAAYHIFTCSPVVHGKVISEALRSRLHDKQLVMLLYSSMTARHVVMQSIGTRSVPELPADERDTYIRQVSSTVGLAALAATVVRVAPGLLLSVCSPAPGTSGPGTDQSEPVLFVLGKLEERILLQLAEAETWKRKHDAATSAKGESYGHAPAKSCFLQL